MSYPEELYWLLPNETPNNHNSYVIVESLNGTMHIDFIEPNFYSWGDDIVRWAYIPDEIYAKYKDALRLRVRRYKKENEKLKKEVEYYRNGNETLRKDVEDWYNKYLDLLDKQHNEHQREAFVGKRSKFTIDDNCGSINSDGDECPATDDLCRVCKSDDARPVSEVSINEVRDIFLKVLRESRERERAEEDDGK